jgi:hypothetical protein
MARCGKPLEPTVRQPTLKMLLIWPQKSHARSNILSKSDPAFSSLKPVSSETLDVFDGLSESIENEVLKQCLSTDRPEIFMGPAAATMIKSGLDFVSKMLHAMMSFGSDKIMQDELNWGKARLPVSGVSAKMVLNNFERYSASFEKLMPSDAYAEMLPYLNQLICRQRIIFEELNVTPAKLK